MTRFLVPVTTLVGVLSLFGGSALADNVPYRGGCVQHAPTFYAVYWLPSNPAAHFEGLPVGDQDYENRINQFVQDISSTNLANVVSQYTDQNGSVDATHSKFGGSWVDTNGYPHNTDALSPADIEAEVDRALNPNAGNPNPNAAEWQKKVGVNTTVFVFTAAGINMCNGPLT
jgi:hypothetical protein